MLLYKHTDTPCDLFFLTVQYYLSHNYTFLLVTYPSRCLFPNCPKNAIILFFLLIGCSTLYIILVGIWAMWLYKSCTIGFIKHDGKSLPILLLSALGHILKCLAPITVQATPPSFDKLWINLFAVFMFFFLSFHGKLRCIAVKAIQL